MPYCLDDRAMVRMRFATDRHLTPEGHRWAAMALLDILKRTVLSRESPMSRQESPRSASGNVAGNGSGARAEWGKRPPPIVSTKAERRQPVGLAAFYLVAGADLNLRP